MTMHVARTPMGKALLDENGRFVSRLLPRDAGPEVDTTQDNSTIRAGSARKKGQPIMNAANELKQAVARHMRENSGSDFSTALKEVTSNQPRLWERYVDQGGTEAIFSEANITQNLKGTLRRLKCEPDHDAKGVRILDAVTGDVLGMTLSRREIESALDKLTTGGPRIAAGSERRHRAISRLAERFDETLLLAAKLAEHFDNHLELNPEDAQDIATALKEVTKANPSLWTPEAES